jgi:Tol biopolymer transport system component
MAPEQVAGHNLDARTDLWSTGVVLYEMLTGRSPFCMPAGNAPIATVIHKILNEDPPPVQELAPEVPAWVARILERCLEKNPNHRFQTMAQLKSALQQASAVSVAQSGLHKRNVLLLTATIIIILAIAAVARRFGTGPAAPPSFRSLTYSGRDFSPAVSPDGRTIAFTSDRDGPPRIWLKQINGAEVPLTAGPDDAPRFSPDATTVLFVRREGAYTSLFTIPVVGGEPRRLVEDVIGADFSPDGAQIGLIRWQNSPEFTGSVFATIKSDGSEPVKELVRVSLKQLQMPRWSPDGSHIASVHSIAAFGSEIVVVTRDGQVSVLDPQTELAISGPAWLSSGQHLVYVRGDYAGSSKSDLVRHSLRSKELTILHTAWPHESRCLDIVGNGRVIFDTSSRRSNLREIPLHGGTGRWLTRGTSMDRQPVFSTDGERVAFTSDRSGNTDIWQMDLGSRQLARLVDHPADDLDPAYTPDGKGIIWTSGRSGHFEIYLADRDGGRPRRVTNDGVDAQNATMTRDGRWIVYVSSHPVNKGIWKIRPDGSAAARLASGTHFNPEVSPDGKYSLYITSVHPAVNVIRVVRIEDGVQEPFEIACEIRRPTRVVIGRARWNSNNQTIVFIGQDENGVHGIFEQPFAPGKDTSRFRRRVGAFDPDTTTESFGISRDGKLIVASWDQLWTLIIADQIPGITYRRQNAP